jgi:hypothetical protein
MHIHVGGQCDHEVTFGDPKWAKYPWQPWDFTQREKVMDVMKV